MLSTSLTSVPLPDAKQRPAALPVQPQAIPEALQARPQWVCWRFTWKPPSQGRAGKWDKVPYNARTGQKASSTNPATWSTFAEALAAYQAGDYDGIGFVLTASEGEADALVALDLDKCRDPTSGQVEPWAQQILEAVNTYTELSPSGAGLRLFAWGRLPTKGRRHDRLELYQAGRYLTVTGHHLPGTPTAIEPRRVHLAALYDKHFPSPPVAESPSMPVAWGASYVLTLPDQELLHHARHAANGAKFQRLWAGDTSEYVSSSEADLALCALLAFWTGPDSDRVDRLFRLSGLMRKKWNRTDYRKRTIAKALGGMSHHFAGDTMNSHSTSGDSQQKKKSELVTFDPSLESGTVEYLIPHLLAKGMLSVLYGERDCNKSTLAQRIAAQLSCEGQHVLYYSAEENWQEVLLPKFRALNANFHFLTVLSGKVNQSDDGAQSWFDLGDDGLELLRTKALETHAVLMVFDPIASLLPDHLQADKQAHVRKLLFKLKDLSETLGVAILGIAHINKDSSQNMRDRMNSSAAWTDAPRFVYLMLRDPDDRNNCRRYVVPNKANLLKDTDKTALVWQVESIPALRKDGSQLYDGDDLVTVPTLNFVGASDETIETLCDPDRQKHKKAAAEQEGRKLHVAKTFLQGALGWGPRPANEIKLLAAGASIAGHTLDRAKKELGVASFQQNKQWLWTLSSAG